MDHRPLQRKDFEGKTILEVDVRAVNIIRFYFTDGTSIAIEHERDGMVACEICTRKEEDLLARSAGSATPSRATARERSS